MTHLRRYAMYIAMLAVFAPSTAHSIDIPKGIAVVTAPEVRKMVAANEALLVHTLSRIEYRMQHIPGSINIPVDEVKHSPRMPTDRDAPIIFYCNGLACPYSRRAAEMAVQQGFTQVYWFRGGIVEWRKFQYTMQVDKSLSSIKVAKLSPVKFRDMARGDVLVLDVRPKWWRQSKERAGIIKGTEMIIPLLNLDKRLDLLPRDRPILLVDRLMRQTPHAAKFLKMKDFKVLGVLKGGSKRWVAEGMPVLKQHDEPTLAGGA